MLLFGGVVGIVRVGRLAVQQILVAKLFNPFLIGSGGEVEIVITPNAAGSNAAQHVVEVHIFQPVFVRFFHEGFHQTVRLEPALGGTVRSVVVEDALEIDLCFRAALVDALHDALDVGENLFRLEVQTAAGGDVVRANHQEELLRFVDEIALQVVTLFGGVGAGVSAVYDGERNLIVAAERFDPGVHVRDAVAHKHDASFSRRKDFEEVVPMLAERLVTPRGKRENACQKEK